jgi:glycine hydroxymethyltransferase
MNYIQKLTAQEFDKQKNTLNLIASENYPSPAVLNLLGSVWSNKYGEGYPSKRFYAGNQFTDKVEDFACQKALEVFDKTGEYGVNVQTLSGSPANQTVYIATLEYGDTILSPELSSGGHLTHMHQTSSLNKFFKPILYHVKENTKGVFEIDIDDFKQKISSYKQKLVIIGFSAFAIPVW